MSVVRVTELNAALGGTTVQYDHARFGARAVIVDIMVSVETLLVITELRPDGSYGGNVFRGVVKTGGIGGPGHRFCLPLQGDSCKFAWTGSGTTVGRLLWLSDTVDGWGSVLLTEGTVSINAATAGALFADAQFGRVKRVWLMASATKASYIELRGGYGGQTIGPMARATITDAAGGGLYLGPVPCANVIMGGAAMNNDGSAAATFAFALVGEL